MKQDLSILPLIGLLDEKLRQKGIPISAIVLLEKASAKIDEEYEHTKADCDDKTGTGNRHVEVIDLDRHNFIEQLPADIVIDVSADFDIRCDYDPGDRWTPPCAEEIVTGCRSASITVFDDGSSIIEQDITSYIECKINPKHISRYVKETIKKTTGPAHGKNNAQGNQQYGRILLPAA